MSEAHQVVADYIFYQHEKLGVRAIMTLPSVEARTHRDPRKPETVPDPTHPMPEDWDDRKVLHSLSTVLTIHCTVLIIHCTALTIHCTVLTIHCTVLIIHCTVLTIHCTALTIHCTVLTIHCTVLTIHCTALTIHCTALTILGRPQDVYGAEL
jgi:hypothetical protein